MLSIQTPSIVRLVGSKEVANQILTGEPDVEECHMKQLIRALRKALNYTDCDTDASIERITKANAVSKVL